MQLYNLLLPLHTNDGRGLFAEHAAFEHELLKLAGGYTVQPEGSHGVWTNEAGTIIRDSLRSYTVAVPPVTIAAILASAHKLFSDQVAIYVSEVGTYGLSYAGAGRVVANLAETEPFTAKSDMVDGWFSTLCRDLGVQPARPVMEENPGDVVGTFAPPAMAVDTLPRSVAAAVSLVAADERRKVVEGDDPSVILSHTGSRISHELRNMARLYGDASWAIDSASRELRKARQEGSVWRMGEATEELTRAIAKGDHLL